MADSTLIRVMIVDDSELLRLGLRSSLEGEGDIEVVGEFESSAAAVAEVERLRPNVVLLSVSLADSTGLEACRQIIGLAPRTRVIMLTSHLTDEEIAATMLAGGAGCLPKNSPQMELIRIVRYNGNGAMYHTPEVAEILLRAGRYNSKFVNVVRLSSRERKVLLLLVDGLRYKEIGAEIGISPYTVRSHASRLFAKLNVSRRSDLGAYAPLVRILEADGTGDE